MQDQIDNPQNYKYKVVSLHATHEDALFKEVRLHKKFDVAKNSNFYNKAVQTSRKFLNVGGYKLSDTTKQKMSNASKLRASTKEFREHLAAINKGNKHSLGYTHSEAAKLKIGEAAKKRNSGVGNPSAKPANIYDYATNKIIASNVIIAVWAKDNGYTPQLLNKTARSDRSLPSSDSNPLYHKGIYAVYI